MINANDFVYEMDVCGLYIAVIDYFNSSSMFLYVKDTKDGSD